MNYHKANIYIISIHIYIHQDNHCTMVQIPQIHARLKENQHTKHITLIKLILHAQHILKKFRKIYMGSKGLFRIAIAGYSQFLRSSTHINFFVWFRKLQNRLTRSYIENCLNFFARLACLENVSRNFSYSTKSTSQI